MIELIALIIMFSPVVAAVYFFIARRKLVRYLANNHPILCEQLNVFNNPEVQGYSGKLSRWVSTKSYTQTNDINLGPLAKSYHKAKMLLLFFAVAAFLTVAFLGNENI